MIRTALARGSERKWRLYNYSLSILALFLFIFTENSRVYCRTFSCWGLRWGCSLGPPFPQVHCTFLLHVTLIFCGAWGVIPPDLMQHARPARWRR